jgi:hypothetical protein
MAESSFFSIVYLLCVGWQRSRFGIKGGQQRMVSSSSSKQINDESPLMNKS